MRCGTHSSPTSPATCRSHRSDRASSPRGAPVDVPALVVWGDRDGVDPQAAAERLADGFLDAEVLVMGDAGHAAYESQPKAFTVALLDFIATLDS
ncbi:MAG: alpha/beta hydrolase [Acidimicrobiales bacterium]